MKNLKDKNKLLLSMLMGAPLLLILILQIGLGNAKATVDYFVTAAGLIAVSSVVLVMLSDIIPQSLKHKLVFLRLCDELPGHRCDKLCFADSRLAEDDLKTTWPNVFGKHESRKERNGLWYKHIYKPVMNSPQVRSAHQKFLLYRDATAGSLVIIILLTAWAWYEVNIPHLGELHPWAITIQGLFIIAMLFCAQSNGKRMVVNATVVKTSGD